MVSAAPVEVMPPEEAVMVVEPVPTAVANPTEPTALLSVAVAVDEELHVTAVVRFAVEPFEYVPMAVNCRLAPLMVREEAGTIVSDTRATLVTVNVVAPVTEPTAALMVVEPTANEVARPTAPALLTVATVVSEEVQVAVVVTSCTEPSE